MYIPCIYINIVSNGQSISFYSANDIVIKKSIYSPVQTAIIKIPASTRLRQGGILQTESVQTSKQFVPGDSIEISLGYNSSLLSEFKGFIKRINYTTPCEIECEGYSYQLRRTDLFSARYKNVSVKSIMKTLLAGTDVTLHPDSQDITVTNLHVTGKNALEAINSICTATGCVAFFAEGSQLYIGLKYGALSDYDVKYKLGYNTIKNNDLKYRSAEDQKAYYNITYKDSNGKEKCVGFGKKGGETFNYNFGEMDGEDAAKALAQVKSSNRIYEGYEGKLTTFLIPYCAPAYTAHVLDDNYKEREGAFIVTGTEVRVGMQGARRIINVGPSVTFLNDNKV